ncbi:MAG: RdgB/HAM1 family non-canonical purine NTP pyrophosphatase [Acidothermaceae bacterium]
MTAQTNDLAGRRVVLATRNAHKLTELRRILAAACLDVELVSVEAYPDAPEVAETGDSFEANALLKARAIAAATDQIAIADDSGLAVDALNGMPGIFSARWSGDLCPDPANRDDANLRLVLSQVDDVPDERRGASFVCAAAVVFPDGVDIVTHGRVFGSLIRAPRGSNGFGYDPIFVPTGQDRTTAEMSADEKDAISHRGEAFRKLARMLGGEPAATRFRTGPSSDRSSSARSSSDLG